MPRMATTLAETEWHESGNVFSVPAGTTIEVLSDEVVNQFKDEVTRASVVASMKAHKKAGSPHVLFRFQDGKLRHMDASLVRFQ